MSAYRFKVVAGKLLVAVLCAKVGFRIFLEMNGQPVLEPSVRNLALDSRRTQGAEIF